MNDLEDGYYEVAALCCLARWPVADGRPEMRFLLLMLNVEVHAYHGSCCWAWKTARQIEN